jgi:hypothetical protein
MRARIDKALTDARLLGAGLGDAPTWSTWLATLRAAFGLKLDDADVATFHRVAGDREAPTKRVRELWCVAGRRSGKSRMAAATAVFLALFQRHRLASGETGFVLVLAATRDQAAVVFEYARGFIASSTVLAREVVSMTTNEIRLRNGVTLAVHPNSFRTVRGRTLLAVIFDEVSIWRDESTASPDIETYRAVMPSLVHSGGMLVGISTPYRRLGLLHQKHRDHFGVSGEDVLVVQGGSTVFNPLLDAGLIDASRAADPEAAVAEWDAQFRADISAFLSEDLIELATDRSRPPELPPRKGVTYRCFVDASGGRHDSYTVCIAHKDGERIVVDVLRGAEPPFDPQQATREIAALAKEYWLREVYGDAYSADWIVSAFKECEISYEKAPKDKSELYIEGLPLFARGLVSLPEHRRLGRELRLLERHVSRAGRDRVDHGRGGHDDHANAVFGALHLVASQRPIDDLSWVDGPDPPNYRRDGDTSYAVFTPPPLWSHSGL